MEVTIYPRKSCKQKENDTIWKSESIQETKSIRNSKSINNCKALLLKKLKVNSLFMHVVAFTAAVEVKYMTEYEG